jgi:hypothetical protein
MTKRDRHLHAGKLHGDPEVLDADIRPSDLVEVLRRLKFEEQFCVLWLDKPCLRISHHGTHQFTAEVTTMLLLKPRHQVMIEQAAIRLPTEKQSAFFDRVTGQLQRQQFSSTGGWPTATSPTRSRGCCAG